MPKYQMVQKYLTNNPSQTRKLGKLLAEEILKTSPSKGAVVIGLEGDLGGGKTTFLQGFAKGLKISKKILSPTFVIMKRFTIKNRNFKNFYHIDCYRIEKPKEILNLGFEEIASNPQNIVAIEWSDKIGKILPKDTIKLKFEFVNKNKREIVLKLKNGK